MPILVGYLSIVKGYIGAMLAIRSIYIFIFVIIIRWIFSTFKYLYVVLNVNELMYQI